MLQSFRQDIWKRWSTEYLHTLQDLSGQSTRRLSRKGTWWSCERIMLLHFHGLLLDSFFVFRKGWNHTYRPHHSASMLHLMPHVSVEYIKDSLYDFSTKETLRDLSVR